MKISLNWLRDYIHIEATPEQIAQWLTDTGLEVEALEKTESVPGGLKGVVIGEVISCKKHPDADRLSLTEVDTGEEILPIVCGAPNVASGQKVVVATVGTTLYPLGGEPFEIKKAKIRGQASRGMICAEDELGLGTSHDGIMVLEPDTPKGMPASQYFKIEEDHCIEIGLTPNRIDAASHIGVARDLAAAVSHLKEKAVAIEKPDISAFRIDETSSPISIEVQDHEACIRYSGLSLSDIQVKESPDWLKNRLKTIGLKPINNIVDITNFVLHETGQPLHAFDARHIKENKVIIRKPRAHTPFITLDEQEVKLTGNDLMICNAEDPMCMAGILGGLESGVTSSTRDIFLESACFEASGIRKSSKHHTINTDSSFRFERGADPNMTLFALKRAALLIKEIAGGRITSDVMDEYPHPVQPHRIDFTFDTANRLIGKTIKKEVIKDILKSLDIHIAEEKHNGLLLEVPPYRVDVTREADIVEEILRIYGYNNVELPERLHANIVASPDPDKEKLQNVASDIMSNRGFHEIMNNSLTKASYYQHELFDESTVVKILNPLSQDLGVMRQTLFFGGMETIAWNQNRKIHDLKIYEFGNVYLKEEKKEKEQNSLKLKGYNEKRMLALFMAGALQPESWYAPQRQVSLFDIKAEVSNLLHKMNISLKEAQIEELNNEGFFEAGLRCSIKSHTLFELGEVKREFLKDFDIKQEVFYASVKWDYALELQNKSAVRFQEPPRYPEVRRDLALLVHKNLRFSEIEKIALNTERKLLKKVRLFDIYMDDKIGKDKKSYAVSFTLSDPKKTLTDKEIDKAMKKISAALTRELDAAIR